MKRIFTVIWLLCLSVFLVPTAHSQATFIPRSVLDLIDAPRHIDVRRYGVNPNATAAVNATGINAALAAHDSVTITKPGTYLVSASLNFKSNNSLTGVPGVIIRLANGTRTYLLKSNNYTTGSAAAVSGRLTNIRVEGIEFDVNGANNLSVGNYPNWFGMGSLFRAVDGLTIRDCRFINAPKYCIWISDCTKIRVSRIDFNSTSDGIHFGGANSDVIVRDLTGTLGDDVVPFGTCEWGNTDVGRGSVSNVLVEDINVTTTGHLVRFWCHDGATIRDITVRNIRGSTTGSNNGVSFEDPIFNAGNPDQSSVLAGPGDIDRVLVEGVQCNTNSGSQASVRFSCAGGRFVVRDIQGVNPAGTLIRCDAGTNIKSLIVENVQTTQSHSQHIFTMQAGGVIARLQVTGVDANQTNTANVITNAGTINQLILANVHWESNSADTTGMLVRNGSTSAMEAQITNCRLKSTGTLTPYFLYSEGVLNAQTQNIVTERVGSSGDVVMAWTSGSNANIFWSGSGVRRLNSNLVNPYAKTGSGVLRINNPDAPVNCAATTILTPVVGDRVLNTNAGSMQIGNGLLYTVDVIHWWNGLDWQLLGARTHTSAAIAITPTADTIAAGAVYTVDVTMTGVSGMNANWSARAIPPTALEAGLLFNVFAFNGTQVRLRIANPTASAISTVVRNWRFVVTDRQ